MLTPSATIDWAAPDALGTLLPVLAPLVGSFLATVIVRLPAGRSSLRGRSACRSCGHTLGVADLVPVLSWLGSRGRCRHCGEGISLLYPSIEIAATLLAVWAVASVPGWRAIAACGLAWTLLVLAAIDARHFILPDVLTLPLGLAGLAIAWLGAPQSVLAHAAGAAAGFIGFAGVRWLYRRLRHREGLGLGDAKLLAAAGAWVMWQGLPSIVLLAAGAGLAGALANALARKRINLEDRLPFGPYLCFATWLVWLYGPLAVL